MNGYSVTKITPPIRSREQFGFDIDAYGSRLLVDGLKDSTYLFNNNSGSWLVEHRFGGEASSSQAFNAIAIDENRMLLSKSSTSGHVEVYTLGSDGNWSQTFIMYGSDQEYNDNYGVSVALDGNKAMVGTSNKDTEQSNRLGVVYAYEATDIPYAFEESEWFTSDIEGRLPKFLDFDNDGDLDLFLSVSEENHEGVNASLLYENTGSSFESTSHRFPYVDTDGFAKWTHMNYDELPDLLVYSQYGAPNFRLYINTEEGFEEKEISFPTFDDYQPYGFHFADFDNDGDEDVLIQGYNEYPYQIRILENNGNFEYQDSGLSFDGYYKSQNPWGDFNSDGWIDFMAFEDNGCDNTRELVIYRNMGDKSFHKMTQYNLWAPNDDLLNRSGTAEWFDYNGDSKLDIVLAGQHTCSTGDGYSMVMINEDNDLFNPHSPYGYSMFGDYRYSVDIEHADFNNDGKPDVFMYGEGDGINTTNLWLNGGDVFSYFEIKKILRSSWVGSMDAADFDGDGDVDLVIAGEETYSTQKVKVYRNNANQGWAGLNEAPVTPSNLVANVNEQEVVLTWSESIDDLTAENAIKYNVSLIRNDSSIIHSNYLVDLNGLLSTPSLTLYDLPDGDYRWTVQAIDDSHAASAFAGQEEFTVWGDPLGVNDEPLILIYPNPALDFITIQAPENVMKNLNLTDLVGRVVLSSSSSNKEVTLNLNELQPGLYFLNIESENFSLTKKIICK